MARVAKEVRQVLKAAKKQGLAVDYSGKHPKVYDPNAPEKGFYVVASTPSDHRSLMNTIAALRKKFGFRWKGH